MASISRRDAGKLILGGAAGLLGTRRLTAVDMINSVVRGVQMGAQSYSFRDRPLAAAIQAYRTVGLGECELWQGHVEPTRAREKRPCASGVSLCRFHASTTFAPSSIMPGFCFTLTTTASARR